MSKLKFHQVDVFASEPLLGNPLAVVVGADGVSDERMAAFARWTNLSETTFLLRPSRADADYRVRIFTPQGELPFAGHPTIGTCHVWLSSAHERAGGEELVQECGIGLVRIRRAGGRLAFAAPELLRRGPVEPQILERVRAGLHLSGESVVNANWVDNGPGWLAVLLRSREEVLALEPDFAALGGLRVGVAGPWHAGRKGADADWEVRAFTAAGFEDPVTGSLNAGLACWLIGAGLAPPDYIVSQGTNLGRKGRVHVESSGPRIWIGGAVTSCIEGVVQL